jgi:hypothetical protein
MSPAVFPGPLDVSQSIVNAKGTTSNALAGQAAALSEFDIDIDIGIGI